MRERVHATMPERWEREIDELLRRREAKLRREPVSRRVVRRSAPMMSSLSGAFRSFLRRTPVEQFMIASIFLVAMAFLLSIVPGAAGIAQWASLLSILFFVLAIALSVAGRRGSGPPGAKRWRDRDVGYGSSYGPPHPSLWESLRTWWRRRRFRRL
jgi:preprotein translocase subunit SecG